MDALVTGEAGGIDALQPATVDTPTPAADEVRVEVQAVSLNPVDYKLLESGHEDWTYPHVPGVDAAGVVDEVGADVTDWQEGDAVYYHGNLARDGTFAEYVTAPAHVLAPMPATLSFEEAAAIPCAGFTAYQALYRRLGIGSGETILVHGGSGGVGGYAVQLANRAGLDVYTTCSPENDEFARGLGANVTIDYKSEDPVKRVLELTDGRGVDHVVDTVGGESPTEALDALAFGGGLACILNLPDAESRRESEKALSVHKIMLGGAHLNGDYWAQVDLARMGREMGQLLANGDLDPMVGEIISFDGIPDALGRLSRGETPSGKVVARLK